MSKLILALDQGTTSSRSILFNRSAKIIARAQQEIPQIFPSPGHVEHDPETIWRSQVATAKSAMRRAKAGDVVAIGIANQRETVVLCASRNRPTDGQCHCLAESHHGTTVRKVEAAGCRAPHSLPDGSPG